MELNKAISIAKVINENLNKHLKGIWQGFEAVPFILYNEHFQVAVGEGWPQQYKNIQDNIWVAEGTDQTLMGCTAIKYHGRMIAIWDLRAWDNSIDVPKASAGLAHEMFHVFQLVNLRLSWSNELLLPAYPHTAMSIALVFEENKYLKKMLETKDEKQLREYFSKLVCLREQRQQEIPPQYLEYDQCVEGVEGTAVYVETKLQSIVEDIEANQCAAGSLFSRFEKDKLLVNYRHRCYAVGAILCYAADILCPNWQTEWAQSKQQLFSWLKEKLLLPKVNIDAKELLLAEAKAILENFNKEKLQRINTFLAQELICIEGNIALNGFDPMNLSCIDDKCLHLHGMLKLGKKQVLLSKQFLEVFADNIMNPQKFLLCSKAKAVSDSVFEIEGYGEFEGTLESTPTFLRCIVK